MQTHRESPLYLCDVSHDRRRDMRIRIQFGAVLCSVVDACRCICAFKCAVACCNTYTPLDTQKM